MFIGPDTGGCAARDKGALKEPQDAILPMRGEVLEELTVATEEFWIPNFADKPGAFPNPCFKISGSPNFHIHIYQEGKGEMHKKKPQTASIPSSL